MANINAGKNLGFKVGSQAALDALMSYDNIPQDDNLKKGKEGIFYLTEDTHRLYVGNADGTISTVNEGVITVDDVDTLPATSASIAGQFYYAAEENILCVFNGTKWVQINSNTDHKITSVTATTEVADDVATIKTNIASDNGTGGTGATKTATYTITGDNGIKITNNDTTGDNATEGIKISGDTYTLTGVTEAETNKIKVKLDSTNTTNDSAVEFAAGDNVTITAANNVITIASEYVNDNTEVTNLTNAYGDTGNKGFKITLEQKNGTADRASKSTTITPQIVVGVDGTTDGIRKTVDFVNGQAVLDMVYTKDEIDSIKQSLNAMTYRGTVGTSGTAASSLAGNSTGTITAIKKGDAALTDIAIGDTFMLAEDLTVGSKTYTSGALIIARSKDGSENDDGYIPADQIAFDVVEATNDTDTTYLLAKNTAGTGVVLRSSRNSGNEVVGSIVVSGEAVTVGTGDDAKTGASITVTPSLTGDTNTVADFKVKHDTVTRNDTEAEEDKTQASLDTLTIPVITAIKSDATGHITGIETTDYVVVDTNGSLTSESYTATVATASGVTTGTISNSVVFTNSKNQTSTATASTSVSSSTLAVTANTAGTGLVMDLQWGSFE